MTGLSKRQRGARAVTRMASWKEMAEWIDEYRTAAAIKPSELSRMWTHLVTVHMSTGKGGITDEKELTFPDAPIYSEDGRHFLQSLTAACTWRMKVCPIARQ